jgi:hypothetical protein
VCLSFRSHANAKYGESGLEEPHCLRGLGRVLSLLIERVDGLEDSFGSGVLIFLTFLFMCVYSIHFRKCNYHALMCCISTTKIKYFRHGLKY